MRRSLFDRINRACSLARSTSGWLRETIIEASATRTLRRRERWAMNARIAQHQLDRLNRYLKAAFAKLAATPVEELYSREGSSISPVSHDAGRQSASVTPEVAGSNPAPHAKVVDVSMEAAHA